MIHVEDSFLLSHILDQEEMTFCVSNLRKAQAVVKAWMFWYESAK